MKNIKNELVCIASAAVMFLLLAVMALVPAVSVYMDVIVIGNHVEELSVTEITQLVLLLMTSLIFWYGSWRHTDDRGGLVLVAAFFSCVLVRESDAFLDIVWHGFWFFPASIMALVSIIYIATFYRNTLIGTLSKFISTREYLLILFGLVTLLVFSRVFGSGHILWKELLGEVYNSKFRNVLQEGLELYGYLLIFYGALQFWVSDFESLYLSIHRSKNVRQVDVSALYWISVFPFCIVVLWLGLAVFANSIIQNSDGIIFSILLFC